MLVLASCLFYFYYSAGRFNNTYKELDEKIEAVNGKTVKKNDTLPSSTAKADTLHQKQNSKGN